MCYMGRESVIFQPYRVINLIRLFREKEFRVVSGACGFPPIDEDGV